MSLGTKGSVSDAVPVTVAASGPGPDKRARILAATARLIVTNGLDFPMSRISTDSGVAVGSIYNHFPSKQDLVVGVYRQLADQINAALTGPVDGTDDPKSRIMAYIHGYIDFFWADADRAVLFEYLSNVPPIDTPEVAEAFRPLRDYNSALFSQARDAGVLKPLAPKSMAGFVGGGIRNTLKWHRATGRTFSAAQKEEIARMCWAAIAADTPA